MHQSYEQEQQCFIPARSEQHVQTSKQIISDVFEFSLSSMLPSAKQILYKKQPLLMIPRTCFLELNMKLYPQNLDKGQQSDIQMMIQSSETKSQFQNQQHKTIKQYFNQFQYKLIYNHISQYCSLRFAMSQMMNRFKNISLYQEYNQKLFQQLKRSPTQNQRIFMDDDVFDSNFECGNLGRVYVKLQEQNRQYFLLLQNDINSHGYTCWFFFKVLNCGVGKARFHIVNLVKSPTMFKNGMKISIFSQKQWNNRQIGWFKGGQNISINQNTFPKQFKNGGQYSSLYFQYTFTQPNDQVYFAMSRPYSYSRLINFISNNFELQQPKLQKINQNQEQNSDIDIVIDSDDEQKSIPKLNISINKDVLSICSNIIPIIQLWKNQTPKQHRKCLVFMGRQHPAQVIGSQVIEQVMKIFSKNRQYSELVENLLNKYLVIFIPMVNPDGVIHGNSRCNLAGLDLNRNWMDTISKQTSPETIGLRKYLWQLHQKQQIEYLLDIHGHSKKLGSFLFSNRITNNISPYYFPCLLSKIEQRFDLNSCTFKTTSDKKNTLRNQLFENGMKNCLTYENSYFGYKKDRKESKHYMNSDYRSLAKTLIIGLSCALFGEDKVDLSKYTLNRQFQKESIKASIKQFEKRQINIKRYGHKQSQQLQLESDSEPEEGLLKPQQVIKIFNNTQNIEKKKAKRTESNTAQRKKTRTKKIQSIVTGTKKKQAEQDQIRQSYPLQSKFIESQKKTYKSQKKINPIIPKKQSIPSRKSKIDELRKLKQDKQIFQKKVPTHQLTIQSQSKNQKTHKTKNRSIVSVFSNYPVSQVAAANLKKKRQDFYATAQNIKQYKEKNQIKPSTIYQKQIKSYLDQTLSILKVNGLKPQKSIDQRSYDEKNDKKVQSNIYDKISKSGMRTKTDNQHFSFEKSRNTLEEKEKKIFLSKNFRKQILKRKRMLSQKEDTMKFKRFQTFMDSSRTKREIKGAKVQGNSVFYHFPIL